MHDKDFKEKILNSYFNISLNAQETKEYYLKVASLSSALHFKLNIMSKDALYEKELLHQLTLALFFGSIISLLLYNLSIYLFTIERAYLYYFFYLLFTGWNHFSYTGFNAYVLSKELWEIDAYLSIYYLSFLTLFAALFTREFLNLQKYKKVDFGIKIIFFMIALILLITLCGYYPLEEADIILLFSFIFIVMSSFYTWAKGNQNAKFLVLGWSMALFGWIMLATQQFGYWTILEEYLYFYEFTIFAEAILFSIALASKLNKTKELEASVATNALLTRELHHRVKNNMQFIISIYRLKLAKYANRDLSNSLKEVEGTIQAMSATHELLYSEELISNLDTKEYFFTLIEKLKKSYENSNIEIKLDIHANLDIDSSIYVGIILNELISNSFKYAFTHKRGEIRIFLTSKNQKHKLIVQDNGVGFSKELLNSSFGLELVKTLVEEELKGSIDSQTLQGVNHTIVW
jgi:two-component sensor histidine kinase